MVSSRFDHEILKRILDGHPEEFATVVEEFQSRIFKVIFRQVGDRGIAEDLTQQVFIKAYQNLDRFRGDAEIGTWLTRIALNETSTYFSSKRYKQMRRTEPLDVVKEESKESGLEGLLPQFRTALSQLSPILRDSFILCVIEGYQYNEVAQMLEISIGTVRSRVNAARLKLSELIQEDE